MQYVKSNIPFTDMLKESGIGKEARLNESGS